MMRQTRDVQVRQDSVRAARSPVHGSASFIAQVVKTYSDRMTCDIKTPDGQALDNVPVLTRGGLVDGKPYGEVCLPAVEDYVIVLHATYGDRHKVIIGTVLPYGTKEFAAAPVNSDNKATATKLLEPDKAIDYRRVFKSGLSVLVEEDGTLTAETPDGTLIKISAADGAVTLTATGTVTITDGEGSSIAISGGDITLTDSGGNTVAMSGSSVMINSNLEVMK